MAIRVFAELCGPLRIWAHCYNNLLPTSPFSLLTRGYALHYLRDQNVVQIDAFFALLYSMGQSKSFPAMYGSSLFCTGKVRGETIKLLTIRFWRITE